MEKNKDKKETCPLGICNGSGIVTEMGTVYHGEPHTALVGERSCECANKEDEYEPDEDY